MTRKTKNVKLGNTNKDIFGKVAFGSVCPELASDDCSKRISFMAYTDSVLMSRVYSKNLLECFGKDWAEFLDTNGFFDYYNAHFILENVGL